MEIFTTTALKQNHGEVLTATDQKPVIITRHNRKRYILMTVEFYYKNHIAKTPERTLASLNEAVSNGA